MKISELTSQEQYRLSRQLLEGEEAQWLGRPERFSLLSKDYKGSLILRWIIAAVVLAALIIAYSVWVAGSAAKFNTILVLIIVLACVYIFVIIPVMDRFTLMNRTFFCVTNKRVLVFVSDRAPISLNRAGLNFSIINGENGCSHIAFGAAAKMRSHRLRIGTITPPTSEKGDTPIGAVFYNIKNAAEVTNLFS